MITSYFILASAIFKNPNKNAILNYIKRYEFIGGSIPPASTSLHPQPASAGWGFRLGGPDLDDEVKHGV